jgi:hypothetical protein
MWQMVIIEILIFASVGGFPVDFGGECLFSLMTRANRKNCTDSVPIVNWMGGLKLLR